MRKLPIEDIALPTGVKGIIKYTDKKSSKGNIFTTVYKGAPVHVKASIKYNDLLKYFGLNNVDLSYRSSFANSFFRQMLSLG